MKRALKYTFLLALLAGGGYVGYLYFFAKAPSVRTLALVPRSAIVIAETDKPIAGFKELQRSAIWQHLLSHPYFRHITQQVNSVDSLLQEYDQLASLVDGRYITLSLHQLPGANYDLLYLVDLQESSKLQALEEVLKPVLQQVYGNISTTKMGEYEVLKIYDPADRSNLHLAIVDNILLMSYSPQLMMDAIRQKEKPYFSADPALARLRERMEGDGLLTLYVNHPMLADFMLLFSPGEKALLSDMATYMTYSGLNLEVEDTHLELLGQTLIADSLPGFLADILASGNGRRQAHRVLPATTCLYTGMLFNDYLHFYDQMERRLGKTEATGEYMQTKQQVEKWLRVNLKQDLFSWIGDEIATGIFVDSQQKPQKVVVIHAHNINEARRGLDHLERQLRRRSPVKFKTIAYKDYEIHYLKLKGFFKLFLGKLFRDMEYPYFTYIDDFVVLAASPEALQELIDQYEDEMVLASYPTFEKAGGQAPRDLNLLCYVNLADFFPLMKTHLDPDSWSIFADNEMYFRSFSPLVFSLKGNETYFDSKVMLNFSAWKDISPGTEREGLRLAGAKDSTFVVYYTNGQKHEEGRYEKGLLEGPYRSYYTNGRVQEMGSYSQGRRVGKWYSYKRNGQLKDKMRYDGADTTTDTESDEPPAETEE